MLGPNSFAEACSRVMIQVRSTTGRVAVLGGHALLGWALCGVTIAVGRAVTTLPRALAYHALAAPFLFAAVAFSYGFWFGFIRALPTAAFFAGFVLAMDLLFVAPFIEHSFAMAQSAVGFWIPVGSIFVASWIAGVAARHARPRPSP